MKLPRRRFLHLAAGATALPLLPRIASALDYPTRPVRVIVGFPAGSSPDIGERIVAQGLSDRVGKPFVVENRPGASTNIATEIVARAPTDGYTLLYVAAANAINATLYDKLSFNFIQDIAPIASVARAPAAMAVTPSFPAQTVPEFIAYAKANPGKINMAVLGKGTVSHVFGELFKMMTGVDLVAVPYHTSFMPDLIAGQVQVCFYPTAELIEFIRTSKLRALAITSAQRLEALPDVPAMGEFVPGYEATAWNGIGAPRGTSIDVIEKLNSDINAVVADPATKAHLVALGFEPMSMTPVEFGNFIAAETEKWGKVIEFANIKPE